MQRHAVFVEFVDQSFCQDAEIDIGSGHCASRGDRFVSSAARQQEGSPFVDHGWIVGELDSAEQGLFRHRLMPRAEKCHIGFTATETKMRNWVDELARMFHQAVLDQPGVELD